MTFIQLDTYRKLSELRVTLARSGESLHLLGCIYGIGYEFSEEDLVVRVEKFLDDREYVLGGYSNCSCC